MLLSEESRIELPDIIKIDMITFTGKMLTEESLNLRDLRIPIEEISEAVRIMRTIYQLDG